MLLEVLRLDQLLALELVGLLLLDKLMLGLLLVLLVLGQELRLLVLSQLLSISKQLNRLLNRLDLLKALYLALDLDLFLVELLLPP